jgi:hypothetical protein
MYAYNDLLHQEFNRLNEARDQELLERVEAEVATAKAELEGLKGVFDGLEEQK